MGTSAAHPLDKGKAKVDDWDTPTTPSPPPRQPTPDVEDMQLALALSLEEFMDSASSLGPSHSHIQPTIEDPTTQILFPDPQTDPALFHALLAQHERLLEPNLLLPPHTQTLPTFQPSCISSHRLQAFPPAVYNPSDLYQENLSTHTPHTSNSESILYGISTTDVSAIPPLGTLAALGFQFQQLKLRKRLLEALEETDRQIKRSRIGGSEVTDPFMALPVFVDGNKPKRGRSVPSSSAGRLRGRGRRGRPRKILAPVRVHDLVDPTEVLVDTPLVVPVSQASVNVPISVVTGGDDSGIQPPDGTNLLSPSVPQSKGNGCGSWPDAATGEP